MRNPFRYFKTSPEGHRKCRTSGDGPLAQQQSRKLTPALPATRAGDGEIQERKVATEIRLNPFFSPQSFQSRPSPQSPRHLKTEPFGRPGRVAPAGGLSSRAPRFWRPVRFNLTAPFWLLSGQIEAVLIFAGLSVADLFLYWSRIGPILDGSE